MQSARRAIAGSLALSMMMACENPFANRFPAASPGVAVPGVDNVCRRGFGCMAWSADSKTLYVVAGAPATTSLLAIDAATATFRVVAPIDFTALSLVPSADGTAIYYMSSDPRPPGGWIIQRMSLSDGSTTMVARTDLNWFILSPDGGGLAYTIQHRSPEPDTIAVLDLATGTRRGTTVGNLFGGGGFSGDGNELALSGGFADTLTIWHLDTGVRDTLRLRRPRSFVDSIAWSDGNFRLLLVNVDSRSFSDTSLAGGSARTYAPDSIDTRFEWLPDRGALWTVRPSVICGPQDCAGKRYDFGLTTETGTTIFASARSGSYLQLAPSPDGQWLAHAEGPNALYLVPLQPP